MATVGSVLDWKQCRALAALYDEDGRFRSTVDMARHRFGDGQYRYFRRHCCCGTAPEDGTRYIPTRTAISSFPSRS